MSHSGAIFVHVGTSELRDTSPECEGAAIHVYELVPARAGDHDVMGPPADDEARLSPRDYLIRQCEAAEAAVLAAETRCENARCELERAREAAAAARYQTRHIRRTLDDLERAYERACDAVDRALIHQGERWAALMAHDDAEARAAGLPVQTHDGGAVIGRN